MVSTNNVEIIEKILSGEMKFTDLNFEISTLEDGFIVELLRWFDKNIEKISNRKQRNDLDNWKTYYEQIVRIFYGFVIYRGIQDQIQLRKIFRYLFSVDKNDNPYRNSYDIISEEKLMKVYNYLTIHTPKKLYNDHEDCENRKSIKNFVGIWDTEEMKNKLDHIEFITYKYNDKTFKKFINIVDDCNDSDLKSNNDKILDYFKDFLKELP